MNQNKHLPEYLAGFDLIKNAGIALLGAGTAWKAVTSVHKSKDIEETSSDNPESDNAELEKQLEDMKKRVPDLEGEVDILDYDEFEVPEMPDYENVSARAKVPVKTIQIREKCGKRNKEPHDPHALCYDKCLDEFLGLFMFGWCGDYGYCLCELEFEPLDDDQPTEHDYPNNNRRVFSTKNRPPDKRRWK